MPHSHHSHSGQYVSHAVDNLDSIVEHVIERNFQTYCLTEHVPRYSAELLYPEEIEKGYTPDTLISNFEKYWEHATRIKTRVNDDNSTRTTILIGYEMEGGISELYLKQCNDYRVKYSPDVVVGSVHHIDGIDIDFDRETWLRAKGDRTLKDLFKKYYELQNQMLKTVKPEVVGHFDLIRLFGRGEEDTCEITGKLLKDINICKDWPDVWEIIKDNVRVILELGSLIEFNSAAIRKGWETAYPKPEIVEYVLSKGGKFCLSDDSHGIKQVGLNYHKVLEYIVSLGDKMDFVYYWDLDRAGNKFVNRVRVPELVKDQFWDHYL